MQVQKVLVNVIFVIFNMKYLINEYILCDSTKVVTYAYLQW